MSINSITIIGRLTADVDTREVGSGTLVAKFSLACNEYFKGEERTSFFDVTAFGKTAEILRDYTGKGSQIAIAGTLRQERWETNEGAKRSKVVIIAQKVDLLSKKNSGGESQSGNQNSFGGGHNNSNSGGENQSHSNMNYDDLNDDLPF